jgi:hypothetical protein
MAGSDGSKPGMGLNELVMSQILAHAAIDWMPDLALLRLRAVLDLSKELRSNPDSLMGDPLAIGLGFADEGVSRARRSAAEFLSKPCDFARVDKIIALRRPM